jgi:hypothetical protein
VAWPFLKQAKRKDFFPKAPNAEVASRAELLLLVCSPGDCLRQSGVRHDRPLHGSRNLGLTRAFVAREPAYLPASSLFSFV